MWATHVDAPLGVSRLYTVPLATELRYHSVTTERYEPNDSLRHVVLPGLLQRLRLDSNQRPSD